MHYGYRFVVVAGNGYEKMVFVVNFAGLLLIKKSWGL
jgi:hypothetical protein